jgi:two-component sensor histidine kinase
MDGIYFNIDTAIPCRLIVNELITNYLKHAFSDDINGDS